ncbi:general substrate transporter [Talaromyces proteolyticus]|uniref:General substrate transporter n=1 Tax=Talaromyces proteolyticus TaxID=1131652 RepID=A0AAD4PW57_9EURO|nr:general substrate transporter [Talaromyces proteolyticus]KAH8694192.1 general substrate transporter [Talaromyces proteolyticus]
MNWPGTGDEESVVYESSTPVTEQALWKSVKQNPRLAICSFSLAASALLYGYEVVFVGSVAALPAFKQEFGKKDDNGDYIVPSVWLSLWAVSGPLGTAVGSLLGGWAQDRFGRRLTFGVASIWQAASITICFLADEAGSTSSRGGAYFGGKLAQGIGMGGILSAMQTYVSEILPTPLRGPILSLGAPLFLLGQFVGSLVIKAGVDLPNRNSYRVPIAVQWVLSIIPFLVTAFLPESPVWLMRKSKWEAAKSACRRLGGEQSTRLYNRLQDESTQRERYRMAANDISYWDLFRKRSDAKRSAIIVFANLIPEFFGLPLLGHSSYLLEVIGMDAHKATTYFIGGVVAAIITNFVAFWLLSRVGRRPLLVYSMFVITILWATVGIVGCFGSAGGNIYTAVGLILVIATAGLGAWPVSYAISGETSTLHLRAKSQGLGWFVNSAGSAVFSAFLPYLYNSDAANLGGKIGFIFCGLSGLACLVSWLYVPEMKGLTVTEVDEMFESDLSQGSKMRSKWILLAHEA